MKAGDVITQVNGKPLHSIEELTALVNEGGSRAMPLTVRRGDGELQRRRDEALRRADLGEDDPGADLPRERR